MKGLLFILNTATAKKPWRKLAEAVLSAGVDAIQFRHKGDYEREVFDFALELSNLCKKAKIPFIINDRFDIALAVNATGVHLGNEDIPITDAREFMGNEKWIGSTAPTVTLAKQKEKEGSNYIGCGHVFPTKTKLKKDPPLGVSPLFEICSQISIPVVAIGGITSENLPTLLKAPVSGFAVISAIDGAEDPYAETLKLKSLWKTHSQTTK